MKPVTRGCQFGFSLIAAVFLIVVLAALGTFAATFSQVQHLTSAQDLEGSRAYQAAQAGIEYGVFQVIKGGISCGYEPATSTLADLTLPEATLIRFRVTVACSASGPHHDGAEALTAYRIISTACSAPSGGSCPGSAGGLSYVERQLEAVVVQ